jgi:hypothetical protein
MRPVIGSVIIAILSLGIIFLAYQNRQLSHMYSAVANEVSRI